MRLCGCVPLTNRFHVAMRGYTDNGQMMSKCGKSKEVRYELLVSSVTDVLTVFLRPLCLIRVHTRDHMRSIWFTHCFDITYPE